MKKEKIKMVDFKDDIWKLEEAARSIKEKSQEITDLQYMTEIQNIQMLIHTAYLNLRKINGKV